MDRGIKVCRDEKTAREPSLKTALAYQAIYGQPVSELFAGLYEEVAHDVAERARLLSYRTNRKSQPQREEVISRLVAKLAV